MNDGMKKILVVVVLLAAIGAVIAAKQFKSKTKPEPETGPELSIVAPEVDPDVTTGGEDGVDPKVPQITEKDDPDEDVAVKNDPEEDGGETKVTQVAEKTDPDEAAAVAITEKVLTETKLPLLLELGSVSCIPCKAMKKVLGELTDEYGGSMKIDFIDVKADPQAGKKYGINLIPTQIFFDAEGKELFRHVGFFSKEKILAKWKELGIELSEAK